MTTELRRIAPVLLANGLVYFASSLCSSFSPAMYEAFGVTIWQSDFQIYHWLAAPAISLAGAVSIGYVGDRWGRKPAIALALVLVGLSALAFALVPPYYAGGTSTIVLYFIIHAVFVFGLGSQFGCAVAYVLELAPQDRAGFSVSLLGASSALGSIIAVVLVRLGPGQVNWRVAVACGALILPMAYFLRSDGAVPTGGQVEFISGQRAYLWPLLLATTILLAFTVTSALSSNTSLPLIQLKGFGSHPGFWIAINLVCAIAICAAGRLYDRVGPRAIMLGAGLPLGLLTLLAIALLILLNYGLVSFALLLVVTVLILLLQAAMFVPVPIAVARLVAPGERARAVNLVYAGAGAAMALINGPVGREMMNFEVMLRAGIWIAALVAMFRLFPKPSQP